jgi:hypothetical protein
MGVAAAVGKAAGLNASLSGEKLGLLSVGSNNKLLYGWVFPPGRNTSGVSPVGLGHGLLVIIPGGHPAPVGSGQVGF